MAVQAVTTVEAFEKAVKNHRRRIVGGLLGTLVCTL